MITQSDFDYCERVVCLGNRNNKHLTIELAERAIRENIQGDFAECGVLSGGHPALMAWTIKTRGSDRRVHLYDSFEGVPMAGVEDSDHYKQVMGVNPDPSKGIACGRCIGTVEQVKENMVKWDVDESRLIYHKGWLQEVLKSEGVFVPKLALLRIDVDLHDSTLPIMEYLYPKMPHGAFIISDDWGAPACQKAVLKYLDYVPPVTPVEGQNTTVWWRKP